jgi:pentatricopeptide repeat protein
MKCPTKTYALMLSPTVLIDGFCKEGKLEEPMELLHEMSNKNICPNVVTYSVLIDGFCKEGKLEEAMDLLHEMLAKTYPLMLSPTMDLLMVSVRKASWKRLWSSSMKCPTKTYALMLSRTTAFIDGFCKERKWQEANKMLHEMLD